jgi:hypothetical protein
MIQHIEQGAIFFGQQTHSKAGAYVWGGHAWRRYCSAPRFVRTGDLVRPSATQALLWGNRPSPQEIIVGFIQDNRRRGSPGKSFKKVRSEIQALSAQLEVQKAIAQKLIQQQPAATPFPYPPTNSFRRSSCIFGPTFSIHPPRERVPLPAPRPAPPTTHPYVGAGHPRRHHPGNT